MEIKLEIERIIKVYRKAFFAFVKKYCNDEYPAYLKLQNARLNKPEEERK